MVNKLNENLGDIPNLKDKINGIERRLDLISKELSKLNGNQSDGNNLATIMKKLQKDLEEVYTEMDSIKDIKRRVTDLENTVEKKLDKEEFEKWKAENDFQKIINGLLKRFADRNEMIKLLRKLEQRIKALEDLLSNNEAECAVLATKPLGGWSCASCQKDLINLEAMPAKFYPWAKFPQRSPIDKAGKIGQGYSKTISQDIFYKTQRNNPRKRINNDSFRIEEEADSQLTKTNTKGLSVGPEFGRPSTAKEHSGHDFHKIY